jgi:hypothetical protein
MSTLDAARGLVVAIAQDVSEHEDEAVVQALLVDAEAQSISLGPEAGYGGVYSVNPQVTRLSASSFAITFLDNVTTAPGVWNYSALTQHGVVNEDLSITLSPAVIFANDDNYELQSSVVGLTASSYLLVTNTAELTSDEGFAYGPLQARVATVTAEGAVTLGNLTSFSRNLAAFNLGTSRLDDSTVLVAYCDYSNNFGISVASLRVAAGAVSVAAALALTSGQALAPVQTYLQMDLDVAVFGSGGGQTGGQFVVTYSDVSSGGRVTAAVGRLGSSGELSRASPDFLLGDSTEEEEEEEQQGAVYQWHALAVREGSGALDAEIAIASAVQELTCDLASSG